MSILRKRIAACVVASSGMILSTVGFGASTTYTVDAEFDQGALDGVNHDAPNNDQLQLNINGTTFPVFWIANAGEDSLTKFDTDAEREVGRYRTAWGYPIPHSAWAGPAPSRTAVDIDGNVYVANRHFDNRPAAVLKILAEGGIDRNGNGVIDTSSDTNGNGVIDPDEMLPVADDGDGVLDIDDFQDERIAWVVTVGTNGRLGRSLCIGNDGNIWLGLYSAREYYKLSASDGSILTGPISSGQVSPYGCLVDSEGTLWSAGLSSYLGELDTIAGTWTATHIMPGGFYGIGLGGDTVFTSGQGFPTSLQRFDPTTNTGTHIGSNVGYTAGVAVDGSGDVFVGKNAGGVAKFTADGVLIWNAPGQAGTSSVIGVVVDSNSNVWTVNLGSNNIAKYDGASGDPLGVFPVGNSPYTYSDASGFAARNFTTRTGTWGIVSDGGAADTEWASVNWNDVIPAGSSVEVEVRTANSLADLSLETYAPIAKGAAPTSTGQFIQVRARLSSNPGGESPVLQDLTISSVDPVISCDIDGDGNVDRDDINLIFAARNEAAAPGDPRDHDGDGVITVNDGRQCTLECTLPRCQ